MPAGSSLLFRDQAAQVKLAMQVPLAGDGIAGRQHTSRSAGRGLPGSDRMGPTILKLGDMGRSHSAAQSTGAIESTSRWRSTGEFMSNWNFLLQGTRRHQCAGRDITPWMAYCSGQVMRAGRHPFRVYLGSLQHFLLMDRLLATWAQLLHPRGRGCMRVTQ